MEDTLREAAFGKAGMLLVDKMSTRRKKNNIWGLRFIRHQADWDVNVRKSSGTSKRKDTPGKGAKTVRYP